MFQRYGLEPSGWMLRHYFSCVSTLSPDAQEEVLYCSG